VLRIANDRFDADANMLVLRGTYKLSRRTALYLTAGRVQNQGTRGYSVSNTTVVAATPQAGSGQTGLMAGMRHSF
jgi:predicted porin